MVLQGSSTTTVAAPSGSVSIAPGQFALVGGKMDGAPKVLTVDVGQVFRSSPLVNSFPEPLPTKSAILSTAIKQQGSQSAGGLRSTGTTGVALTSGGDLLTGGSKPPKSAGYTFEIASNLPGAGRQEKQATATEKNKDDSGLDITTAAGGPTGGGGIVGTVTGSTGGGGGVGGGGVIVPSIPNTPANTGQSGITANPNNPNNQNTQNNLPATVVNAQVQSKTYDGLVSAMIQNALLSGIQSGDSVTLQNDTSGIFANKNVGTWSVSTTMGLTGADASRYILTQPTMSGTITAKDVTIATGTAFGRVYDGNTGATVSAGGLSGLVTGEILGTSTAVGTFASKDVGTRNVTAVYTLTDGADLASNYNLLNPTEALSATITAKALTMTGSTAASKVYDGNRSASVTLGILSGEVAGETLGATTVVGTFTDKNIGTKNVAAVYTLVNGANGELASNYSLAGETVNGTITAKDLSVFSAAVTTKAYDGNDTAVVIGAVLVGNSTTDIDGKFIGTETVTLNGGTAGNFASKNVGASQGVTTTMSLGGSDAVNYTLNTQPTLNGTITAKGLSITAPSIASKIYDGNRTVGAVTLGTLSGFVGSETVTASGAVADYSSANVGSYSSAIAYTLSNGSNGGLAANYSLAGGSATGVITAKGLSIAAPSLVSKVYNGNAMAGSLTLGTLSGFVGSETVTASGAAADYSSANVGTYNGVAVTYTLSNGSSGGLASNYQLAAGSATGVITAKGLSITAPSLGSKVYDGNRTAGVVTLGTLSGFVGSETVTASGAAADYGSANVGTYNGVAVSYTLGNGSNGGLPSNYSLAAGSATGVITAKGLSITAPSIASKVYDGNATAGSLTLGTLSGFVGSETVTASGAAADYGSANVGTYNGVAVTYTFGNGSNGGLASNYSLAAGSATGVITAKGLSITAPSLLSKVYDGNRTAGAVTLGTLSGFVGSETVTASGAVADYSSANVGSYSSAIAYTLSNGSNGGLASNYSLAAGSATGVITAKGLSITAPSIASKVYNGNATAGSLTLGALSGFVGSETVTASGIAADYSSANVGTYNGVAVTYTLGNGSNGGLASNYSLAAGSATGVITAKDVSIASGSVSGKVYDGNTGAVVTAGSVSGLVVGENLGTTTAVGTFASKDVGTRNVAASYTLTDGANLASNYNLLNPTETLSATITARGLSVTAPSIASKKYDGTTAAGVVTVGTLSGFVGSEKVTAAGSAVNYSSANVGSYSSAVTYTLSDGSNGGLASNYSLAGGSATGAIIAKDLVVNASGITVGKVYDGGTSINPATQVSIGAGVLSGSSNDANDGRYIGTETVTLAVDAAGTFERNLPGTMIPISTTVKLASGNAVNNNYTLRAQPTGLTGEITGTANLDQNGVGISVSSADYIHIRNTTTSRMQDGLLISSATGSVLLENSSFDGWMNRLTPNQTISDGGAFTFTFSETVATAVNSPVLRVKMEANNPANLNINKQFMLLGDYQLLLRHDVDGDPTTSVDTKSATLFSFPGSVNDPSGIGSLAPSADLVIRDSATTQVKDLPWDTKEYSSLDGSGRAVDSGNYATVQGEFKGDSAASGLDIATSSGGAAGKWDVTVSDPVLVGEGKVTDVRLKYNNNTKALIQGPTGVRLVNVIFEGMDAVEVGAGLNDKVLMSGTLVSDPNIGKMVVRAGQTLEAHFNSDATMKEVRASAGNAEILAGVVKDSASPTGYSFISGPNRVLEMQTATIAGQLSLASHTIVFNNANITSGGVIDARTRDGMVNRTYGSVVPGTVSFIGGNGNIFVNQNNGSPITMRIDNGSVNSIGNAFSQGHLTDVGSGGSGSVMNVGRVR
jgi:hypothetical protein